MISSFTLNLILSVFYGVGGFLSWNGLANFGVFEVAFTLFNALFGCKPIEFSPAHLFQQSSFFFDCDNLIGSCGVVVVCSSVQYVFTS